jgi:hypothetical protein
VLPPRPPEKHTARPRPGEDRPPWPFIALSALAVLLAMTGIGSSVYRRARRAPASGL